MRVWAGAFWKDVYPGSQLLRWRKTAAGGETSLSGADDNGDILSYSVGNEQVYLNGALLIRNEGLDPTADYTATNGSSITGLVALTAGDNVEVISLSEVLVPVFTGGQIDGGYANTTYGGTLNYVNGGYA